MSLSQIRSYFNQGIQAELPGYVEWRDAFNIANVPSTLLNNRYHIDIGSITSSPQNDRHVEDQASVTVTIWRHGFNDVAGSVDYLLDIADCIRARIIDPKNVHAFSGDIDDVQIVSFTTTEINATNDNIVQVAINFNTRLFFST